MKLNYKKWSVIPALVAVLSLSSCLKEDNLDLNLDASAAGKAYVGIADASPSSATTNATSVAVISSDATFTVPLTLTYFGNGANPGTTVKVKIETNKAVIDKYNTDRGTNYQQLTAASYSLPSTEVTIPAGSKSVTFQVVIKPNTITNATALYALPVVVTEASSGVQVSGNYGAHMLLISIKNLYDGVYTRVGNIQRNSATGPDPALSGNYTGPNANLVTDGAYSVWYVSPTWSNGSGIAGIGTAGVDGVKFTVDPATNKVTVTCPANPVLANIAGYDNYYDPATKKFHVGFQWGVAPNTRVIKEVLTFSKAR